MLDRKGGCVASREHAVESANAAMGVDADEPVAVILGNPRSRRPEQLWKGDDTVDGEATATWVKRDLAGLRGLAVCRTDEENPVVTPHALHGRTHRATEDRQGTFLRSDDRHGGVFGHI